MRRIALYAHYDADREVKRYVSHCLEALTGVCDRLDFVSTAELPEVELAKARRHAGRAFVKDNVGYDFGMWKRALEDVDLSEWDELILANSSVYGPLYPLSECFARMADSRCDFWGMNDSTQHDRHLQSYFIVLRRAVLRSQAFSDFWASVLPYRTKDQIIRSYELGLSVYLRDCGFRMDALVRHDELFPPWPLDALVARKRHNPTIFHPLRMIERGLPFVKVELLRDNPASVPLEHVYRAMERRGFDLEMIELPAPAPRRGHLGALSERLKPSFMD